MHLSAIARMSFGIGIVALGGAGLALGCVADQMSSTTAGSGGMAGSGGAAGTAGSGATAGSGGAGGAASICEPGSMRSCYSGADGTAGLGICVAGTQTCAKDGLTYGACEGEVTPQPEQCDDVDNDCDGLVDAADPADLLNGDPQLCENQNGPCTGTTKPVSLCVGGAWEPCLEPIYMVQVQGACDDGDTCTVDSVVGSVCDGNCQHLHTCPGKLSFDAVGDATVQLAQPAMNYGTAPDLIASYSSTDSAKTFIRFDPFANARYQRIDRAFLKLHPTMAGTFTVVAQQASASWGEGDITWASMPGLSGAQIVPVAPNVCDPELVFDVSDLVRAWHDNPMMNFGLAILPANESNSSSAVFHSKEGPAGMGPQLEIIVNAQVASLHPTADTYVSQSQPTTNFGTLPTIAYKTGPITTSYTRILVQFDVQPIPVTAEVYYAELVLTQVSGQWLGPGSAFVATQSWVETGATWNAQPTYDNTSLGLVRSSNPFGGVKSVGVTCTLAEWVSGQTPNYGLLIRNNYEGFTGAERTAQVGSRENADAAVRPVISVYYK